MDDTSNPHPVDDFLRHDPAPGANAELRQALLGRTTQVLRRRRWLRRARFAGALAACYLAGVLTMRFATLAPVPPRPETAEQPPKVTLPDAPVLVEAPAAESETALALEWRAFEASDRRAELYRLAGDRYLEQHGDLQSALRCYRQALDAGTHESLMISTSDNWLLMALKEARQKEKGHARNGS